MVRCCIRPTELVRGGARSVKGPKRVVVEKLRAAGEKDEKVRVSGEAYLNVPLGIVDSIDAVVGADIAGAYCGILGRSEDIGTVAM